MNVALNAAADIRVVRQGNEQEPVIVIDDALADPAGWRALAGALRYQRIGPFYPGIRSVVPQPAATAMRDELAPIIGDTFGIGAVPPLFECYFSIVTTPPGELAPIQRLPHFDGLEPNRLAILIYLSGPGQGGTAFYRHRSTGFETLDAERFPRFEAELRAGVAKHGLPPPAYIADDTPLYEQIARYEARPNRALIYRGCTLHCAEIAPGTELAADAETGRLTINSFLFDPAAAR